MTDDALSLSSTVDGDPAELAQFLGLPEPAFFDYEYRRYLPDRCVFIEARQNGRLVGTQALVPYPLVISGREMMTGRSERTMVSEEFRGGGVFTRLMARCVDEGHNRGLHFIWGTTTAKVPFQRNGFLFFDSFNEHALLCVRPKSAFAEVLRARLTKVHLAKVSAAPASVALQFASRLRRRCESRMQSRPNQSRDVDQLLEDLRGEQPLIVLRHDERFLAWALEESGRRIRRFYVYAGTTLLAYAYVDTSTPDTSRILDFAARDEQSLRSLVDHIVTELAGDGCSYLYVTYNARNSLLARFRRWLIASGFIPVYRGGGFVVRPLIFHDFNYLNDLSRWYVTGLWFTLYRPSSEGV